MYNAFLFPGQGSQTVGMGRDFFEAFASAREVFAEADETLSFALSKMIFEGPDEDLAKTVNSQLAIFTVSMAILAVLKNQFPMLRPAVCAGLSLGEYSALCAAEKLPFGACLELIAKRAQFMSEACRKNPGGMAAVLGLDAKSVESAVLQMQKKVSIFAANFNCPMQTVISGSMEGLKAAIPVLLEMGAKRIIPLKVEGAFHSGLMAPAIEPFKDLLSQVDFRHSPIEMVMNAIGNYANEADLSRLLLDQICSPVRWEQGILAMKDKGATLFLELGCGKTLSGMNRKIGIEAPSICVDRVVALENISQII